MRISILHTFLLFYIVIFSFSELYAQPTALAVIKEGNFRLNKGDTIQLLGQKRLSSGKEYFVDYGSGKRYLPADKVEIIQSPEYFWNQLWFDFKGAEYHLSNKNYALKQEEEEKILNYTTNLEVEEKFYFDPFVEDYLQQMILSIYPFPIQIDNRYFYIVPKLVNIPDKKIVALPNGNLLIGVDYLSRIDTPRKIYDDLVFSIAHVVLMHGIYNSNAIVSFEEYPQTYRMPKYSEEQKKQSILAKALFMKSKLHNDTSILYTNENKFFSAISGIMSYVAWQEYYNGHYEKSEAMLDKIIDHGLANDEVYFLKARITRLQGNKPLVNLEALQYLSMAEKNPVHQYADLYLEKGLILFRESQFEEAAKEFIAYYDRLKSADATPQQLKWCREMIARCKQ